MVVDMQKRLASLRYLPAVVGEEFTKAVLGAVNLFQTTAGFDPGEKMTAEQIELLNSADAPKSPEYDNLQLGYSGDDVKELQSKLAILKYYDGKLSGDFTEEVKAAVVKFQQDNKLEANGIADPATRELVKNQAQLESTKVGEELVIKTAAVSDNALAKLAETKSLTPGEVVVTNQSQSDMVKTFVILGAVVLFTLFLTIVFMVELKKRKSTAEGSKNYKRKF